MEVAAVEEATAFEDTAAADDSLALDWAADEGTSEGAIAEDEGIVDEGTAVGVDDSDCDGVESTDETAAEEGVIAEDAGASDDTPTADDIASAEEVTLGVVSEDTREEDVGVSDEEVSRVVEKGVSDVAVDVGRSVDAGISDDNVAKVDVVDMVVEELLSA